MAILISRVWDYLEVNGFLHELLDTLNEYGTATVEDIAVEDQP